MSDSLRPHGREHARLPCPSLSPRVCSDSCPLSRWCYPTISSSVIPFSSCLQSFPASAFPMSRFLASGGPSIGASASVSVLPMNIQGWFPLGLIGLISLKSQVVLRTSPASQFFCTQPSLWSNFHICTTGKTIALTILPSSSVSKESLGWEDPLEEGKATYCSILAWRIPWTVESMGSQRVGHDWATFTDSLTWL